jgi:D-hydroxyproline dehydrogenase subunit beta
MTATPAPDVIIIGAGLVGAAIARELTDAKLRVTLVERAFAGGGSSGAAMGHVVVLDDSAAQFALCAHSRARWNALAETLPAEAQYDRCGTLWLATSDDELRGAAARCDRFAAAGVRAELLDATALHQAERVLDDGLVGALRIPDDAVCYPPAIARAWWEQAEQRGATVRSGVGAVALGPHQVMLEDGSRLDGGAIVVATGVHAPELVPQLPIIPRKGHLVITDRRPEPLHHQLVELGYLHSAHTFGGASIAFNVQPRRTGQWLVGSSRELVGFDDTINHALLGAMLHRAVRYVPALAGARVLRTWTGFRPATPDKLPLIGRWPDLPDVWIAAGHEGLGITMATGTADLIVAGLLDGTPPCDPEPFRPERPMPALDEAA